MALVLTQAWPGIDEGVRIEFATDAGVYREMAAAAPGLPEGPVREQHAERWPVHWVVGSAADATGVGLETAYRVASIATVSAVVVLLHLLLVGAGLSAGAYAVCLGVALASAYPFRYWLAAPGMVADAVFGLGLAIALLGLQRRRLALVVAGLAAATAARQTAVPAALALALVLILPATSFLVSRRERLVASAAVALVPLGVYAVVRSVAHGFSVSDLPPLAEMTILADTPRELAAHLARLALGIAVPLAALAAGLGLGRRDVVGPLVLAAAIVAQPFVLTSAWIDANEPRLAGLAVPSLAVACALLVRRIEIGRPVAFALCAALFLGSLHHHYSVVDVGRTAWAMLVGVAALATFTGLTVARRRAALAARP